VYIMTGKPGEITRRFDIAPFRDGDFPTSQEYALFKKDILSALDLQSPDAVHLALPQNK
jgi:hypothetical protein